MKDIRQTIRKAPTVVLGALALSLGLCKAAQAESLDSVLVDMQGLSWSDVQDEASWEAENDATMYSSAPDPVPAHESFEGDFAGWGQRAAGRLQR